MSEKNTNSVTIEQKCNNKKELSVMEHFDNDVNLTWRKPVGNGWASVFFQVRWQM